MHMVKTAERSQFHRFHSSSEVAKNIFNYTKPTLNDKLISVLQVAFMPDSKQYDVLIEFEYLPTLRNE